MTRPPRRPPADIESAPAPPVAPLQRIWRWGGWWAAVLAILLYLPTLWGTFVYDDQMLVRDNPRLQSSARPSAYLLTDWWNRPGKPGREYRPATMTLFAAEHRLWGDRPLGYHGLSLLLHAACAGLFWLLLRRLFGDLRLSTCAALLFAAHPLHVEVVAGIVGQAELLMTAMFLTVLWLCAQWLQSPRRGGLYLSGILVGTLLCVGAKEHGVLLPAFAIALACLPLGTGANAVAWQWLRPRRKPLLLALAAMAGALAIYFGARHAVLGAWLRPAGNLIDTLDNPLVALHGVPRLLSALSLVPRAAAGLLLPLFPAPDYSPNSIALVGDLNDPLAFLGLLGLAAWGAALWWQRRRPALWLGLCWAGLAWSIGSNLFLTIGTIFAERLLFLSSAGVALALCALLLPPASGDSVASPAAGDARTPNWRYFVLAALLLVYGVRTLSYLPAWRDNRHLFEYMVRRTPENSRAHLSLGSNLLLTGELENARRELERALLLRPDDTMASAQLGLTLERLGQTREALEVLRRLNLLSSTCAQANRVLVRLLARQGNHAEAQRILQNALQAEPKNPEHQLNFGLYLATYGHLEDARPFLQAGLPGADAGDRETVRKLLGKPTP